MKSTSMAIAVASFALLTGCDTPSPGLLSLNPLATGKDAAMEASLAGTWESSEQHDMVCIIRAGKLGQYDILVLGGETPVAFSATLLRIGDAELLDLTPSEKNDFRIPGHALVRIWPNGMAIRWAFLDSEWLQQKANVLENQTPEGKMVLLAPTELLRSWLVKVGADDRAYTKIVNWQRVQ